MTQRVYVLSMITWLSTASAFGQISDRRNDLTQCIATHRSRFGVVETVVELIEKYETVQLKTNVEYKPLYLNERYSFGDLFESSGWQLAEADQQKEIGVFVVDYIGKMPSCKISELSREYSFLHHLAMTLFHYKEANEGHDFEENLLATFHQKRDYVHLLEDLLLLKADNDVMRNSIDMISDSLRALRSAFYPLLRNIDQNVQRLTEKITKADSIQHKDQIVDHLFRRPSSKAMAMKLPQKDLESMANRYPNQHRKTARMVYKAAKYALQQKNNKGQAQQIAGK